MAIWRLDDPKITKNNTFDDKLSFLPGQEGFTRALAKKYFKVDEFSYVGTPDALTPTEPVADYELSPPVSEA